MKVVLILAVLSVASAFDLESRASVTPVAKVIEMLQGMQAQGEKEKADEAALYQKFAAFCHDTEMEKNHNIQGFKEAIEQLTADIQKYEADIARLGKEIEQHDADITTWEQDKSGADKLRATEKGDYEKTHADYSESIDALERAVATLKKQDFSHAQALLLQLNSMSRIPRHAKSVISAFLQTDSNTEGFLDYKAPEAAGYEFQSGGVIEMLEKLLTKFEDERASLEKEETEARHAFQLMVQDLDNQIATSTDQRNNKAEEKAGKEQATADAKSELEETSQSLKADEEYLAELKTDCAQKATEFEARQDLRAQELAAIKQAIDVIQNQVSGLAEKHLPGLLQKSFMQMRSNSVVQQSVADFLKTKAQAINSRMLFQLASKVADDPLRKVKAMIQDLINRLMEEANEEAEHKGWCDTELSTNEQTRKQKEDEVETLQSAIDKLTADIAQLADTITKLNSDIASLDTAMAEATEFRNEEHEKNVETIRDAKDAQTAVSQALTILKEFYAKAGEATAFNQQDAPPSTWTEPYKGMGGAAGGVVGMLEVIQSDFARLETETSAAEEQAAKEYDSFMNKSKMDKLSKTKDVEFTTMKKNESESKLATAKVDLEGAHKQLDAALAYYEKLKPSCVDAGVSYEDRVARRKEEIESLQEALRILSGDEIA